jgi:hypothetical protein
VSVGVAVGAIVGVGADAVVGGGTPVGVLVARFGVSLDGGTIASDCGGIVGGAMVASLAGGIGVALGGGIVCSGTGGKVSVAIITGLTADTWAIATGLEVGMLVGVNVGQGVRVAITMSGAVEPIPRSPHEQERAIATREMTNHPAKLDRSRKQGRASEPHIDSGCLVVSLFHFIEEATHLNGHNLDRLRLKVTRSRVWTSGAR